MALASLSAGAYFLLWWQEIKISKDYRHNMNKPATTLNELVKFKPKSSVMVESICLEQYTKNTKFDEENNSAAPKKFEDLEENAPVLNSKTIPSKPLMNSSVITKLNPALPKIDKTLENSSVVIISKHQENNVFMSSMVSTHH